MPCNHKQAVQFKINLVYNLLHELRHKHQIKYYPRKFWGNQNNYSANDKIKYYTSWAEKDANLFAYETIINNQKEINEILNISKKEREHWKLTHPLDIINLAKDGHLS